MSDSICMHECTCRAVNLETVMSVCIHVCAVPCMHGHVYMQKYDIDLHVHVHGCTCTLMHIYSSQVHKLINFVLH